MEKGQKEWETKEKCVYVPPLIEVHEAAPDCLLAKTSFFSLGHSPGDENYDESDHFSGNMNPVETGAKAVILGQEFSFNDVWED